MPSHQAPYSANIMTLKKSKESAEEKSCVRPADRLYFWKNDICLINYGFMRLLATTYAT